MCTCFAALLLSTMFVVTVAQRPLAPLDLEDALEQEFREVAETYAPENRLLRLDDPEDESVVAKRKSILCIGDSITLGYYGDTKRYHSYSVMLRRLLQRKFGGDIELISKGKGGERVHLEMYHRLRRELDHRKYDLVVILGGINDLVTLDCVNKVDLFKEIRTLHQLARSRGTRTVALTILEARVSPLKIRYTDERTFETLRMLTNYKIRTQLSDAMTSVCDTAIDLPLTALPWALQRRLWSSDRVHPTPAGYDKLGDVVYKCIKDIVQTL